MSGKRPQTRPRAVMPPEGSWARLLRRPPAHIAIVVPSLIAVAIGVYGFTAWSTLLSFTSSTIIPQYHFVGFEQYVRLWSSTRWLVSVVNLGLFSALFILISISLGLLLAILLDQSARFENTLRTIFLYPMAISFIVTGVAWKWALNPQFGLQRVIQSMGFETFTFDWLVNPQRAVYTLVIAAVWQSTGFMTVLFLAGLRSVDREIVSAARIDGAGSWLIYRAIIIPMLRPVMLTAFVILLYNSIRSFDLVVALTGGGPGFSSDLPTTFFFNYAFGRAQLGTASASSVMIVIAVAVVIVPYLIMELRHERRTS